MLSFVKDGSRPFDYLERLEGVPEGVSARIVRMGPDLPFDATVVMPVDRVPRDADAEVVGGNAVLHHAFSDLGSAQDWLMAWACR